MPSATTLAIGSTNTWACPCIVGWGRTSAARRKTSAGWEASPIRAYSATAASARLIAGRSRLRRIVRLPHQQPHRRSLAQQAARPGRQPRAFGDSLAAEALARAGLRAERRRRERERARSEDHHGGVTIGPVVQQTAQPGAEEAAQAHADADQPIDAAEMDAAIAQSGERGDHRAARAHAAAEQQHVEP